MPLAVGTGVVIIVVAAAIVVLALIVALSVRGNQRRGVKRRLEDRRDLDQAHERAEQAERERDAAQGQAAADQKDPPPADSTES
jgi:hypothetical protein